MKKYILLFLLTIIFVLGCGSKSAENQNNLTAAPVEETHEKPVNQNADINKELSSLGFLTPTQSVSAPDFTLKDLEAQSVTLSSLKGKVIFINFWGTWCQYCRVEMPSIQRMYDQLKHKDFEILAVSVNDTPAAAKSYIKQNSFTFPVLLDLEYKASQMYGIRGFPTTYLVDKKGNLIGKLVGSKEWDSPEVMKVLTTVINHD